MRCQTANKTLTRALVCALTLSGMSLAALPATAYADDSTSDATSPAVDEATATPLAVTYYAAESEVEGVMSDQVDWSGEGVALAPCTYTRAGYHFVGWEASTTSGTKTYADEDVVPAADFGEEGLLQLVALWEPNTYTLEFDLAGGTMDVTSLACTYGEYVVYPIPVRPGYEFGGWALSSGVILDSGNRALLSTFDGDVVPLTATWVPTTVEIGFDPAYPGGATGPVLESVSGVNGDTPVTLPKLELDGYDFLGWSNGAATLEPGVHTIAEAFGTSDSNMATLVGVWNPHSYTVTFDYAGGIVVSRGVALAASSPLQFAYGDTITAPTPTRTGYVLAGWVDEYGNVFGMQDELLNLSTEEGAAVRLTALWQKAASTSESTSSDSKQNDSVNPRPSATDESKPEGATTSSTDSSSASEATDADTAKPTDATSDTATNAPTTDATAPASTDAAAAAPDSAPTSPESAPQPEDTSAATNAYEPTAGSSAPAETTTGQTTTSPTASSQTTTGSSAGDTEAPSATNPAPDASTETTKHAPAEAHVVEIEDDGTATGSLASTKTATNSTALASLRMNIIRALIGVGAFALLMISIHLIRSGQRQDTTTTSGQEQGDGYDS